MHQILQLTISISKNPNLAALAPVAKYKSYTQAISSALQDVNWVGVLLPDFSPQHSTKKIRGVEIREHPG